VRERVTSIQRERPGASQGGCGFEDRLSKDSSSNQRREPEVPTGKSYRDGEEQSYFV
jgi:hypothetical protein